MEGVADSQTDPVLPGMPPRLLQVSPTRLLSWLTCPRQYRMAYLDRPRPPARPQRAHTSLGIAVHNALRRWWDLPPARRAPSAVADLVHSEWIDVGFRDAGQSRRWRERAAAEGAAYLAAFPPPGEPIGVERTVAFTLGSLAVSGRVDRLDIRVRPAGPDRSEQEELVVVDYKTSRRPATADDARTSLPLALYAAAAERMFRRPCRRVELHHVPSAQVVAFEHTAQSRERKLAEATSIGAELRVAAEQFAEVGAAAPVFAPNPSPLCRWCDYRALCPPGQQMGPERSSWAALEADDGPSGEE